MDKIRTWAELSAYGRVGRAFGLAWAAMVATTALALLAHPLWKLVVWSWSW